MDHRDAKQDAPHPPPPAGGSGKPTPVRVTMGSGSPDEPDIRFEGRPVFLNDEEWWAQELGWTTTGRPEDRGALLLLVGFRPASSPEGSFQREALLVAPRLADVPESALEEALVGASEFQEIPEEPKPFFGPRGQRRGGGRPRPRGRGRNRRGGS